MAFIIDHAWYYEAVDLISKPWHTDPPIQSTYFVQLFISSVTVFGLLQTQADTLFCSPVKSNGNKASAEVLWISSDIWCDVLFGGVQKVLQIIKCKGSCLAGSTLHAVTRFNFLSPFLSQPEAGLERICRLIQC
jgi:hypothetical protein